MRLKAILREKPETLKGKLQRGHGRGYLEALQTPRETLAPILIDCICNDARWDRQVEFREEYYAALAADTQIDIGPLDAVLKAHNSAEHEEDTELVFSTLAQLAIKNHTQAIAILREYVWYGYNWGEAIYSLAETNNERNLEGLDAIICGRYSNDNELWKKIEPYIGVESIDKFLARSNLRLQNLLNHPQAEACRTEALRWRSRPKLDYTGHSIEELFDICDLRNIAQLSRSLIGRLTDTNLPLLHLMVIDGEDAQKMMALRCLGSVGTKHSFEYLKEFLERMTMEWPKEPDIQYRNLCAAALHNIDCAPPEICLEMGRQWFGSDQYPICVAGQHILEKYAILDDIPMLRQAIMESLEEEDKTYKLCSAVDALKKFPNIGMFPEVERTYNEAIYSHARARSAEAMAINAPIEFAEKYAYECLYDCDGSAKLAGISSASTADPGVYQRLKALSDDPCETEDVRREADERLF